MSGISASLGAHHDHLEALLGEAVIAARSGNWAVYRARFSALRVALAREHGLVEEHDPLAEALAGAHDLEHLLDTLRRAGSRA